MKKLAFVINVFREDGFHSGGERVFYELVSRAVNNGWLVDLYCTTYLGSNNILKAKLNKISFIGHPKDFKCPDKIEKFYNEVKKLIKDENYDHVISENISPVIDICILQGHSLLHYRKLAGNIFLRFLYWLQKYKFINAQKTWMREAYSKIIVPSNVLKEELKENFGIGDEKFAVIYPGVDAIERTEIATSATPAWLHACNGIADEGSSPPSFSLSSQSAPLNDNIIVFGLSAPSFANKGGYVFLKALYLLKKKGHNFSAKIVYQKANRNLWLQFLLFYYGLRDFIEFLPYQENMKAFYYSVDVVVMPSLMETFGLVALEAMANGKPVVVSSFCGASEVLPAENVFEMKNHQEINLSEKLIYIIENKDKYQELAENSYEIAKKYSWEVFCNRFEEIIYCEKITK